MASIQKKRTKSQLAHYAEYQRDKRKQKKEDLERLEKENSLLSAELQKQKLMVEQLEQKLSQQVKLHQIAQTVFENTIDLIQSLPHNSPYRRPLLFWFTKGLSMDDSMTIYGISKRTYNRLVEQKDPEIVARKYGIGVTRERITQEQRLEITRNLDVIIPVQSGGNYRYQEITDRQLYNTYYSEVTNGSPVSKSFFIYSVVAKERVRHSKARKFCPLCEQLESGSVDPKLLRHKELIGIQRLEYKKQKQNIGNGTTPTTALVTQDFTQIQFEGSFVQDLIICIYKRVLERMDLTECTGILLENQRARMKFLLLLDHGRF